MQRILLVGFAGLIGTLARYGMSGWVKEHWAVTFPVGTLLVNLVACLLIGFLYHAFQDKYLVDPVIRTTVLVGFLGGFSTFSSYGLETFNLLHDGELFLAGLNMIVSNVAGIACVWAGYALSRSL